MATIVFIEIDSFGRSNEIGRVPFEGVFTVPRENLMGDAAALDLLTRITLARAPLEDIQTATVWFLELRKNLNKKAQMIARIEL